MNTQKEAMQKSPGRKRIVPVLSDSEIEGLERVVRDDKEDKTETSEFYPGEAIKGKGDDPFLKKVKKTLRDGEPRVLNRKDKKLMECRAGQLKGFLQKFMVPKSHIGLRQSKDGSQNLDFVKSVHFMAKKEMSREFVDAANEYKDIMRELHPEEPELSTVEFLRPDSL